jgi:hypothetical protein
LGRLASRKHRTHPQRAHRRKTITHCEPSFRDGALHQTSDAQLRIGESRDSTIAIAHPSSMLRIALE